MRKVKVVLTGILVVALCANVGAVKNGVKKSEAKEIQSRDVIQEKLTYSGVKKVSAKKKSEKKKSSEQKKVKDSQGLVYTYPKDEDGEVTTKKEWVVSAGKLKKKKVVIPAKFKGKKVVKVDGSEFSSRKKLTSITIGKNIKVISDGAFAGCVNLSKVKFKGNSLVSIGDTVFANCASLKKITLPKNLHFISHSAFSSSGLEEIVLPDKMENLWDSAFEDCKALKKVTLSKQIKEIRPRCFEGCTQLNEIVIPEKTEVIREEAFTGCEALENVIFEGAVDEIEKNAFSGTPFLEKAKIGNYCIINGLLLETYGEVAGELEIDGTQGVEGNIIRGISGIAYANSNLNKITIKNMEVISGKAFENNKAAECSVQNVGKISPFAFYDCEFTTLTVENIKVLDECFSLVKAKYYYAKNIGQIEFASYAGIPKDVEIIVIDGIEKEDTIPNISMKTQLENVVIRGNISEMDADRMGFCPKLKSLTIETPLTPEWTCFAGKPYWFQECSSITDVYLKCGGVSATIKGVLPTGITLHVPAEQVEEYKKYVDCNVVVWE